MSELTCHKWCLIGGLMAVLFAVGLPASAQDKPAAPAVKDDEKPVDYEAVLNDRLSKGIVPERNAVVLIWKAIGPANLRVFTLTI